MRFILGAIFGAFLTIGGAYIADSSSSATEPKLVNWTQVEKSFAEVRQNVMIQWRKLTG